MHLITFQNEDTGLIVGGEAERVRERHDGELVHLREDNEEDARCSICGGLANVWVPYRDKWDDHPARCTTLEG